jgi:lysophospholipase L1-like esterase
MTLTAMAPLGATASIAANTDPVMGKTNRYDASAVPRSVTLAALSTLNVGARVAIRKIDTNRSNAVSATCAGADTFLGGATTAVAKEPGETIELEVVLVSAVKYWTRVDGGVPLSALDVRHDTAPRLLSISQSGAGSPLSIATSTVGTGERFFQVATAASGLCAEFVHWLTDGTFFDIDPGGSISFNASIRINGGTIYRLTFGGRTTATLDPGGKIRSDTTGLKVEAGDIVGVRTYLSSGTAYAPLFTYADTANGLSYGGFTAASDLTAPGSAAIAATSNFSYGPAALLGYPSDTAAKSVLIIGDSIAHGTGDGATADGGPLPGVVGEVTSGGGFIVRALAPYAGILNIARSGDRAQWFATDTGRFRRLGLADRCRSAIIEYGVNDLFSGRTAAQMEADLLAIAKITARSINAYGVAKIYVTTVTPRSTSSDGWATVANQTVDGNNPIRVTYNNWVRAGCPIDPTTLAAVVVGTAGALLAGQYRHPITGYFEVADTVESARDSGKWKACDRVVTDAAVNVGTNAFLLSSTAAAWTATGFKAGGDLGKSLWVAGAGTAGAGFVGFVKKSVNATDIGLAAAAITTVSGATMNIGTKTIDGTHPSPQGHYLMAAAIDPTKL